MKTPSCLLDWGRDGVVLLLTGGVSEVMTYHRPMTMIDHNNQSKSNELSINAETKPAEVRWVRCNRTGKSMHRECWLNHNHHMEYGYSFQGDCGDPKCSRSKLYEHTPEREESAQKWLASRR